MKQLLQHYKEVKEKANPNNWTDFEKSITNKEYAEMGISNPMRIHGYQKEQLELENLLYGYWERNIVDNSKFFDRCEENGRTSSDGWARRSGNMGMYFSKWLDNQLKDL